MKIVSALISNYKNKHEQQMNGRSNAYPMQVIKIAWIRGQGPNLKRLGWG